MPSLTFTPTFPVQPSPTASSTPPRPIPEFSHVIIFMLENKELTAVIGNGQMPAYNAWARENTLLSAYYAVSHPSLPNYIALIAGDTFGITSDCEDCYLNQPSLPDEIETSGRTWRTYQEHMPQPCFAGSTLRYAQKHDPFVYFDSIRNNPKRCQAGVVPLTRLEQDLAEGALPNYAFIMPDLCNSSHDCALDVADAWLKEWVGKVMASSAYDSRALIVLTWDEGNGNHGCCGLDPAGGRVATVLISPLARQGFTDPTPYTHYSLLKTIETAWGLPLLGHSADANQALISAPFPSP